MGDKKPSENPKNGYVHVYTGNGKGKTTASLGLALRALGHGLSVCMVQFMKGKIEYGEVKAARQLDGLEIRQFGRPEFVDREHPLPIDRQLARRGLDYAKKIIEELEYDMVILDEINVAIDWGLIDLEEVVALLRGRPPEVEIVLTGRHAKEVLIEMADLVTEMREIKHYFRRGIVSREGIDY